MNASTVNFRPVAPRVRPLVSRPGARYRCFGDGLCCSDIHALGPLGPTELVPLRRLSTQPTRRDATFEAHVLTTKADGTCTFLEDDRRCGVHRRLGPRSKPVGCRRFPLGLVATPQGGRVTTEHRCSCRTMGLRPPVDLDDAARSLSDLRGHLRADLRVDRVRIEGNRAVRFDVYLAHESALFSRLAREAPSKALGIAPFATAVRRARAKPIDYRALADELDEADDGTAFGRAAAWFASGLRRGRAKDHERPWGPAFARAERRPSVPRAAREVFSDWVADEVWALGWTQEGGSLRRARAELATRVAVAGWIAQRLVRRGAAAERAAAEAVLVVSTVGASEFWTDVAERMPA